MQALLRPLFVGALSITIASAGLWGGRVALASGNAAPTAVTVAVSPTVVVEGDTVTLTVQLDSVASQQLGVQVDWGDAKSDAAFINPGQNKVDPPFSHLYVDNVPKGVLQGLVTIAVRVENATTSLRGSASVLVKNAPPTMTSLAVTPSTITAGAAATVSGTFADVGRADRHSVMVDWGDGDTTAFPQLPAKTYNFSYAHTYVVGGLYTLTARVTDDDTGWVEASVPLTVLSTNQPPSNLVLAMSAVAEGGTSTLTGSFTDPDPADTHNVTVNWGDGSAIETLPTLAAGVKSFTPSHTYGNSGPYTVTVVLNDSAGHSITGTTSVTVSNVAPKVTLAAPSSPVAGDNLVLSGTFTDPGTADSFALSVDWGDATVKGTPVLGADGRSFTASHIYSVAGSYLATVTVTDRDGASGVASVNVVVRVNAPPTTAELLDQLSSLVRSFDLDRTTEHWLLHRIDELKASLADGSDEFCDALRGFDRLSLVARRTLTNEQIAALSELATKLQVAAHCPTDDETGQQGPLGTNLPAVTPAQHVNGDKNDQEQDHQDKKVSDKSEKNGPNDSDRGDSHKGARD